MIKHDLKNWIYTNDLEGLLFFAQRLNEALFDFSPDRYKAPTLFTISSCLELLRTASSVKNGVFPLKTLETVFEEFKSSDATSHRFEGRRNGFYDADIL